MAAVTYSIKKNRIKKGLCRGFSLENEDILTAVPTEQEHYLFLQGIDAVREDMTWGRLHFETQLSEDAVCLVYVRALNQDSFYRNGKETAINAFLTDPEEPDSLKVQFFQEIGAKRCVNTSDILLYEQSGRYLYLMIKVIGEGANTVSHIRVEQQGDNFMDTFPEIYRERDSFFHRYLSVFSSIYQDFQEDINQVDRLLDLDTCPQEMLPMYGRWMGIELGDECKEEPWLRTLIKEAYRLNCMRGSKWAIERIAEIVLGEPVVVLESNVMKAYVEETEQEQFKKLYGDSPYDVTILINRHVTEALKSRLMLLINQYRPIRSRIHIVYLKEAGNMDYHTYMDMNARMIREDAGQLDTDAQYMDGIVTLQ